MPPDVGDAAKYAQFIKMRSITMEIETGTECWVLSYRTAEEPNGTVFHDVWLSLESARAVAHVLASEYADAFEHQLESGHVGNEYTFRAGEIAKWTLQPRRLVVG